VHDLHFEAGGPAVTDSGQPAYRLIEIECGGGGPAHRFGCCHRELTGPWPLDRFLARLARRSLFVLCLALVITIAHRNRRGR
jgi:hypothetical protein